MKYFATHSEELKLRNAGAREEGLPLLSYSGVSQHWTQYSRAAELRLPLSPGPLLPRSGVEVEKTLAFRKSSTMGNPRPGDMAVVILRPGNIVSSAD